MKAIEVNNITKRYKDKVAIKDASFSVLENSICGIIGPNGAGKTTILKTLVGFLKFEAGTIKINNNLVKYNVYPNDVQFLKDVPSFYDYLTAYEYLLMIANLQNIDNNYIATVLRIVSLEEVRDKRIATFSRGMRQRLGIAGAIIAKPKILILDEPISALDPIGRKEVFNLLRSLKSKMTILFSSHILTDIERICDSVVMINNGKIVLNDSIKNIEKNYFKTYLTVVFKTGKDFETFLKKFKGLSNCIFNIEKANKCLRITCSKVEETQKEIIKFLDKEDMFVESLHLSKMNLEDIFIREAESK